MFSGAEFVFPQLLAKTLVACGRLSWLILLVVASLPTRCGLIPVGKIFFDRLSFGQHFPALSTIPRFILS